MNPGGTATTTKTPTTMTLDGLISSYAYELIPSYLFSLDSPDARRMEASQTDVFLQTPLYRLCEQGLGPNGWSSRTNGNVVRTPNANANEHEHVSLSSHPERVLADAIHALVRAYPEALTDVDEEGRTVFHAACASRARDRTLTVRFLCRECVGPLGRSVVVDVTRLLRTPTRRHSRNTALQELCRAFGEENRSVHNDENESDDDATVEVLRMLLKHDPVGGLIRNRTGRTALHMVFSGVYSVMETTTTLLILRRRIGYPHTLTLQRSSSSSPQQFHIHSDAPFVSKEFRRRWRAVLIILCYAASTTCCSHCRVAATSTFPPRGEEDGDGDDDHSDLHVDNFHYLHAALMVDRTSPIFDVLAFLYGDNDNSVQCAPCGRTECRCSAHSPPSSISSSSQNQVCGCPQSSLSSSSSSLTSSLESESDGERDYPCTLAARIRMSDRVATHALALLLPPLSSTQTVRYPSSNGRTILMEAISSQKPWSSLELLLQHYPESVRMRDMSTLTQTSTSMPTTAVTLWTTPSSSTAATTTTNTAMLFPFMVAAVEDCELTTIYQLLSMAPDLVMGGTWRSATTTATTTANCLAHQRFAVTDSFHGLVEGWYRLGLGGWLTKQIRHGWFSQKVESFGFLSTRYWLEMEKARRHLFCKP